MRFITVLVTDAINSCNSRAFRHDKLSIFNLKHLGKKLLVISPLNTSKVERVNCDSYPQVRQRHIRRHAHLPPDTDQQGFQPGHSTTSGSDNKHSHRLQPKEAIRSNGLQHGRAYCGIRYSSPNSVSCPCRCPTGLYRSRGGIHRLRQTKT